MALWLVRAGKYGEHEKRFFTDGRCYLTWDGTEETDLSTVKGYEGVKELLAKLYPDEKPKTRINWASQIAPFVFEVQTGDWVVLPRKHTSALAFAEVVEGYAFDPKADATYRHSVSGNQPEFLLTTPARASRSARGCRRTAPSIAWA